MRVLENKVLEACCQQGAKEVICHWSFDISHFVFALLALSDAFA